MIDDAGKAMAAGHAFRQADVDLIFLHVSTYALSSTVLPVVRRSQVPVILLNLSPLEAIDYTSFLQAWNSQGAAHHCAIGVGSKAGQIVKLAQLLGIECVKVC